jgi:phosphatidylinositol alpha-1,6-mannosyltransferase
VKARRGGRLTLLSFDYPPNDGGVSRLCASLASALFQEGVDSEVVTRRSKTSVEGPYRPAVPTRTVPAIRGIGGVVAAVKIRSRRRIPVIASNWYPEGLIARLSGVEGLAIMAHGAEIFPPPDVLRRKWWPRLERSILESAGTTGSSATWS